MSRAKNYGFENKVSIGDGLDEVINWYSLIGSKLGDYRYNAFK